MDLDSLLKRLDALESQQAIRQLKADYMQACDDRRGAGVAELFWDDGIWEGESDGVVSKAEGREAIAAMFAAAPKRLTFTVHYLTNESIDVHGDAAQGAWKLFEPCTFQDRLPLWMAGRYVDQFERRNGVWRIKHLKLKVEFRTPYESGWHKERFARLVDAGHGGR